MARGSGSAGGKGLTLSNQKTPLRDQIRALNGAGKQESSQQEDKPTYQNSYGNQGRKNQKLFEDESEEEEESHMISTDNRSNLVKEMFYKDKSQNSTGKTRKQKLRPQLSFPNLSRKS